MELADLVQPIRQDGRGVTLALVPGRQEVSLAWRQNDGIRLLFRPPEVSLGAASVNARASIALGRVPLTPVRAKHRFLLSLGLTQAPLPISIVAPHRGALHGSGRGARAWRAPAAPPQGRRDTARVPEVR